MICKKCGANLTNDKSYCIRCGFDNNQTIVNDIIIKDNENIEKTVLKKNNKYIKSLVIVLISVLVCLYFIKFIGPMMDSLGVYVNEGDSPDSKTSFSMFLYVLPAFIIQLVGYIIFKNNEIWLKPLVELIVKLILLYSIHMLMFSVFGVTVIWYYIIILPFLLVGYFVVGLFRR